MGAKREKAKITSSIFLSSIQTVPEEITGNWHYRNIREGRGEQGRTGASRGGQGEQRKAGEARQGAAIAQLHSVLLSFLILSISMLKKENSHLIISCIYIINEFGPFPPSMPLCHLSSPPLEFISQQAFFHVSFLCVAIEFH